MADSVRVVDLLAAKADGLELTDSQIQTIVQNITSNTMDGEQMGAFLMAVYQRGMTKNEMVALTRAMMQSGRVMQWPSGWVLGDKHSTGGVGDKVSLPLTPALAACGLKVPMISGRGLMHTGGTLDKMESIPGFRVGLTESEMMAAMERVGCVIAAQTADLVPADRRMYAARDITATVASTPLIVSSILSKKGAESLTALVMDVKFGEGAFMKTKETAVKLATTLVDTMAAMGVTTTALITSMEAPIGRAIGNALEVKESLECLHGGGPADLLELVLQLGGELLTSAGLAASSVEGREKLATSLKDGSALDVFRRMLIAQGVSEGDAAAVCSAAPGTMPPGLRSAECTTPVTALKPGVIVAQAAMPLAVVSGKLGAGRERVGDAIMHDVGIVLDKVIGEYVAEGEVWATIHHREGALSPVLLQKTQDALVVDAKLKPFPPKQRVVQRIVVSK